MTSSQSSTTAPLAQPATHSRPPAAAAPTTATGANGAAPRLPPAASAAARGDGCFEAARAAALAAELRRFKAAHPGFQPPSETAAAPRTTPQKRHTLEQEWLLPGQADDVDEAGQPLEVTVELLDTSLDSEGYSSFHVIGWNGETAVLGTTLAGSTHLRVVPLSQLPWLTVKALRGLGQLTARTELNSGSYLDDDFLEVTFVRGDGEREQAFLFRSGPFQGRACNAVRPKLWRGARPLAALTNVLMRVRRRCERRW